MKTFNQFISENKNKDEIIDYINNLWVKSVDEPDIIKSVVKIFNISEKKAFIFLNLFKRSKK